MDFTGAPEFSCGSSREHAPCALDSFGVRCQIASRFANIFYINCFKKSILPIVLSEKLIGRMVDETLNNKG